VRSTPTGDYAAGAQSCVSQLFFIKVSNKNLPSTILEVNLENIDYHLHLIII
jgi:hypothetical protein